MTTEPSSVGFACPDCKCSLLFNREEKKFWCRCCGRVFANRNGLIFLLPAVLEESYKHEEEAWKCLPREANSPPWLSLIHKRDQVYYMVDRIIPQFQFSGNVLEIGAGTCWASALIKLHYPSSRVYAFDVSTFALTKGEAIAKILSVNIDHFCVGDGERLPFEDGFFNVVFGCSVLHHFVNLKKAMVEIYRVLNKTGSYVGIGEFSKGKAFRWMRTEGSLCGALYGIEERALSITEWKRAFAEAGFETFEVVLDRDWRYVSATTSWLPLYYRVVASLPLSLARFLPISITIRATKERRNATEVPCIHGKMQPA